MTWFIFALCTMLLWGTADLFYKKGADEGDKYSHLKTVIAVGVVMGAHAIFTLIFGDIGYNFVNILKYLPVSLMYILSMAVGYFGLRYLELSVSSPVQNSSGALVCILCVVFLHQTEIFTWQVVVAVVAVCAGVFALGVLEKKENDLLKERGEKKYRIGFVAFFMPVIYCVVDALGTFFDAFYLDDVATTPLVGVTEDTLESVANTSYELTFLLAAVVCFIFIKFFKKQKYGIKDIRPARIGAAVFETAGQFTYVYAMSGQAAIAAPMVAAYSIVSMVLSRVFLKEKLNWKQYLCIAAVMTGIILLGIFADV
ncbi:MAG: EamA family transporter [Candidatus Borkfalkiaceae bacterium]|nr:EamA family transporter [Clostridia bacterium]MDY6223262.1 EamA family transporter [Christensenellaceae bacterium]